MAETDFSLVSNGAGNAKCLKTDADSGSCVGGFCFAAFKSNGNAERISPNGIFKSDGLNALYFFFNVYTF